MIGRIQGTLVHKTVSQVIVDTQGVGYRIFIPLTTYYELTDPGQAVTLHIHTQVKQDGIHLFGFHTPPERDIFQMMITVSGIGPKLAMNVLSGISAAEFVAAVSEGDLRRLTGIPGVGKKMAQRLVLELRDKVLKMGFETVAPSAGDLRRTEEQIREDALSALMNLGYKEQTARKALDQAIAASSGPLALDGLLRGVLKELAG